MGSEHLNHARRQWRASAGLRFRLTELRCLVVSSCRLRRTVNVPRSESTSSQLSASSPYRSRCGLRPSGTPLLTARCCWRHVSTLSFDYRESSGSARQVSVGSSRRGTAGLSALSGLRWKIPLGLPFPHVRNFSDLLHGQRCKTFVQLVRIQVWIARGAARSTGGRAQARCAAAVRSYPAHVWGRWKFEPHQPGLQTSSRHALFFGSDECLRQPARLDKPSDGQVCRQPATRHDAARPSTIRSCLMEHHGGRALVFSICCRHCSSR